jgi:hypothetical protein
MPNKRSFGLALLGSAVLIAATHMSTHSFAVTPPGCFSGVWMINEQLTKRVRGGRGLMVFLAPWGQNGWVRASGISGIDVPGEQSADFHFVTLDDKLYPIFGSDPRYSRFKKVNDFTIESTSVREGEPPENRPPTVIAFTPDCNRMTWTAPQDASGNRAQTDIRVYDKLPAAGPYVPSAMDRYFGAWTLNRPASILKVAPMETETVVLAPWGNNGWAHITVSGGYQPDDFRNGAKPIQQEKRPQRTMYWASWDGRPAFTSGFDPAQVVVRRVNENSFTIDLVRIHQPWQGGDRSTVVFSNDGRRMTITRSGVTEQNVPFQNDVRVYDKVSNADWPGDVRR